MSEELYYIDIDNTQIHNLVYLTFIVRNILCIKTKINIYVIISSTLSSGLSNITG